MSILSAIKQQNSSIDDLAKLPQVMIMQMAQKGEIREDMLAPILGRKAEMADAVARTKALQNAGQTPPTVMENLMAQNAQAEQPAMEDTGVAQLPMPERQYAGGGIIAFADGGMSEEDYEDYEDKVRKSKREGVFNEMMSGLKSIPSRASDMISNMPRSYESSRQQPSMENVSEPDQARKFNVGNLRPSGFSYPGQIGISKGGFAMFDSPEAGIKALQQDISIKLNRGLDTPHKFISVYAPESDKNDVKTYSRNVANMLGIGSNDKIPNTLEARQLLAQAITRQEGAHKATAAFAQGGEIRHFDVGGDIDAAGAELDALRSGTKTLQEALMSGGSRGGAKEPELQAAYENAARLTKQKESDYEALMNAAGVNKPAFYPTSSLSTKPIFTPNPIVQRESAVPPPSVVKQNVQQGKNASSQPRVTNEQVDATLNSYLNKQNQITPTQTTPEQDYFAEIMAQNKEARAELKKSAAEDKNLALLAAGLGMMGGTSPYALTNIGLGGQKGVEQYGASKARRASELAALNKSDINALEAREIGKYRQSVISANSQARLSDDYRLAEKNIVDRANNFLVKNNPKFSMLPDDQKSALLQQEINKIKQQDPYFQGLSQQLGIQPMPAMQQNRTINFSNIK